MAIVLELLSRKNQSIRSYRFSAEQISIGRNYHNDLQLDDPYVCPQHLEIRQHGDNLSLHLADCDSINGVSVNGKTTHNAELRANDVIKLGRTRLRVVDTEKAIAATLLLSKLEEKISWLASTRLALSLTIGYLVYALIGNFITSVEEFKLLSALPKELAQMAVFCTWPLAFAMLAKMFKKESHLITQFNLMWLLVFLANILYLLEKIFLFNVHASEYFQWLEFLVFAVLVFAFIWFSLFIAFHQPTARRNITTAIVSVVLLMPILSFGLLDDGEFSTRANYDANLLPPIYKFTETKDSSQFISHSRDLFAELEQQIKAQNPDAQALDE